MAIDFIGEGEGYEKHGPTLQAVGPGRYRVDFAGEAEHERYLRELAKWKASRCTRCECDRCKRERVTR